jgi:5-methylcytosine-specific restriction endonuclease McrA
MKIQKIKKRRKRRKYYNWELEIAKGNTDKFYNSTDFDIAREKVLERDKGKCQFFLGKWNDGKHFPNKIKIVDAKIIHHIIPIKQRPDLALDINNMVSLSFEAHEIIEERTRFRYKKKKRISQERW